MKLNTITPEIVTGKTVIVRVDYNVPLTHQDNGSVTIADDQRIAQSLPTLNMLREHGARIILMSHLGRPKSPQDTHLSLKPIVQHLATTYSLPATFIPALTGEAVIQAVAQLQPGTIVVLENLRFDPREKKNDLSLAKELANLAHIYVNDAFSASHRAHASTQGITQFLPAYAGLHLTTEVQHLQRITNSPEYPLVIVLGGAKISDKVGSVKHLAHLADIVLVGGATANNFLVAEGFEVYRSFLETDTADTSQEGVNYVQVARTLIEEHRAEKMLKDGYIPLPKILFPIDVVAAPDKDTTNPDLIKTIDLSRNMQDTQEDVQLQYLDIGPKTRRLYSEIISTAQTLFWNGPMGVWENPLFTEGTKTIAQAIAANPHHTVVAGGDTISAIHHIKPEGHFEYVSTAGGATLEFLSGTVLPGIAPLLAEQA